MYLLLRTTLFFLHPALPARELNPLPHLYQVNKLRDTAALDDVGLPSNLL